MSQDGYLLDNREGQAGARFAAMAELFDGSTFRHIEMLGIVPGWRCWEVGAGGTTVARGLAKRVGPTGRVVATDIDLTWMHQLAGGPIEVARHDVARDAPHSGPFDLVHARLLMVNGSRPAEVAAEMARLVKPGGWVAALESDVTVLCYPPHPAVDRLTELLLTSWVGRR